MGRSSTFTQERLDAICERLADGEPLAQICRDEGMPHDNTVRVWANADPEIAGAIARAREAGEDAIVERMRQTARGKGLADGGESTGDVQRDKLIVDLDTKLLAKWNPRRWSDKLELSSDPARPLFPTVFQVVGVEPRT